jgi:hypothetical protein
MFLFWMGTLGWRFLILVRAPNRFSAFAIPASGDSSGGRTFYAVFCHAGYLKASFWIAFLAARSSGSVFRFGTDANSLAPVDSQSWKVALKNILWPRLFSIAYQITVPFQEPDISCGHLVLVRTA